jgi:hypothetical protein
MTGDGWLGREPDFIYTADDALMDGVHRYVADGVAVTATVAGARPDWRTVALQLAEKYRAGVYADPPDPHGEADAWLAVYRVEDAEFYVQDAGAYLVVMFPEDY